MKAMWKDTILAESEDTIFIEGNHYFPPESIRQEFFRESDHHSICHWKGTASYYDIAVEGDVNSNAAWYYPETTDAAKPIRGYIGFWRGVVVEP